MPRRHAPLPSTLSTPFAYAEARAMGVTAGRLRGSDLERPFHATRILPDPATRSAFAGPQAIDARVRARVLERARAYSRVMSRRGFFTGMTAARFSGARCPTASTLTRTCRLARCTRIGQREPEAWPAFRRASTLRT